MWLWKTQCDHIICFFAKHHSENWKRYLQKWLQQIANVQLKISTCVLNSLRQKYQRGKEVDPIMMIHDVYQVFLACQSNGALRPPLAILGTSSTSQIQNHSTTQLMLLSFPLTTGRPAVESGRLGWSSTSCSLQEEASRFGKRMCAHVRSWTGAGKTRYSRKCTVLICRGYNTDVDFMLRDGLRLITRW